MLGSERGLAETRERITQCAALVESKRDEAADMLNTLAAAP